MSDSVGVRIIETAAATARRPVNWVIDSVPDLQIGRRGGEQPEYYLFRVSGVIQFPNGRIVVVDGGSREIRFFGPDGAFLYAVGRGGQGPGEYAGRPRLIPAPLGEGLFVFDRRLRRITALDSNGKLLSTQSIEVRPDFHSILGFLDRRLVTFHTLGVLSDQPGLAREPETAQYRLLNPTTGHSEIIGSFQGQHPVFHVDRESGSSAKFQIPFDIMPSAAVGNGHVYLSLGEIDPTDIRVLDKRGNLRQLIRLGEGPRRVTASALNSFIEWTASNAPSSSVADLYDQVFRDVPLPDYIPSFDHLLVDELGYLWARTFFPPDQTSPTWLVFGPDGRGVGSIQTPFGLDIQQIGSGFILGVWRDDLGVEYVRRHALTRSR